MAKNRTVTLYARRYRQQYSGTRVVIQDAAGPRQQTIQVLEGGKIIKTETRDVSPETLVSLCDTATQRLGLKKNGTYRLDITITPVAEPKKK